MASTPSSTSSRTSWATPSAFGAINIPGTPTTAVVGGSFMNSCFRASETGEMTGSDVTAVLALYPRAPTTISFRTSSGHYLVAENGGGSVVNANRAVADTWEAFRIINLDGWNDFLTGDRVALQATNGQYVAAEFGGGLSFPGSVNANRSTIGPWEAFVIVMQ